MLPKHYNIMDLNRQCLGTIHVHCWVYHLHILHALIIFGINMKFDQYSRNICLMQASRGSNCWAHRAHPPQLNIVMHLQLRNNIRATSHTRLRAPYHYYTSSNLIGEKDGAGPTSLHITLEGPTEHVYARWM